MASLRTNYLQDILPTTTLKNGLVALVTSKLTNQSGQKVRHKA